MNVAARRPISLFAEELLSKDFFKVIAYLPKLTFVIPFIINSSKRVHQPGQNVLTSNHRETQFLQ
jgi:hypothetical protein